MNDVMISSPGFLDLFENVESHEYSGEGLAYRIFDSVHKQLEEEQAGILKRIADAVPAVAQMIDGLKKNQKIKLVFSDEVLAKIKDGTYRLMEKKDAKGLFKAIVVDGKGKVKAIPDLFIGDGLNIDVANMAVAMQGMAIQQQLRDIAEQLNEMSKAIGNILLGQHNDRIAMYYSAEAIYREALSIKDPIRKKEMTSSAIIALTNAVSMLQVSLIHDISEICSKYDMERGRFAGIKTEQIKEKMFLIVSAFQTIHNATTLKAAIYYKEGEYAALTTVLSDYKLFLENSLTERNAHILYLADSNEKRLDGIWNIRQNELPKQIDLIRIRLNTPAQYALEAKREALQ